MYPDWPRSREDLVPLPQCDGPKLNPFNFKGDPTIEFIDYLGEGLHAHVFKVRIDNQIYALKLFRFLYDDAWMGPFDYESTANLEDRELMSTFYDYSEPFNCECRAFGRLQEAGHEDLSIRCFGYVLLDEKSEAEMARQFPKVDFNGDVYAPGRMDMRSRFLGRDGRAPPIRGIVKEFGHAPEEEDVQPADFRKMLHDIPLFQQLGIFYLDVAARQMVSGKFSDFSTAITVPHFVTTPELNPRLTADMREALETETFRLALDLLP
ncbi:kinetochore Sim4 complex subunit Fta2 [Chaetomium sp. MPI-SDFR-AT-0129]|nr:kinetochore Sim4 complex subunit Fta2 [Chaetomium sp. MPI-SDFR-AT-0129]